MFGFVSGTVRKNTKPLRNSTTTISMFVFNQRTQEEEEEALLKNLNISVKDKERIWKKACDLQTQTHGEFDIK